jgi:hypothetical protein
VITAVEAGRVVEATVRLGRHVAYAA